MEFLVLLSFSFGLLPGTHLVPSYSPRERRLADSAKVCETSWFVARICKVPLCHASGTVVIWCWVWGEETCQLLNYYDQRGLGGNSMGGTLNR